MSGQWQPDQNQNIVEGDWIEPFIEELYTKVSTVKLLTEKQVQAAHDRTLDWRFPTVRMYLIEFTKQLNLELQKQD
jgi:hypothetical protein